MAKRIKDKFYFYSKLNEYYSEHFFGFIRSKMKLKILNPVSNLVDLDQIGTVNALLRPNLQIEKLSQTKSVKGTTI